jgi:hypothetical protein
LRRRFGDPWLTLCDRNEVSARMISLARTDHEIVAANPLDIETTNA